MVHTYTLIMACMKASELQKAPLAPRCGRSCASRLSFKPGSGEGGAEASQGFSAIASERSVL